MAWEKRGGPRRYFYGARRKNGRVVKNYIGSGPMADLMAQLQSLGRAKRKEAAAAAKAERIRHAAVERSLAELTVWRAALGTAALVTGRSGPIHPTEGTLRMTDTVEQSEPPAKQKFVRLADRAAHGDPHAREALRQLLDACPQIWHRVADLGGHAQAALIDLAAGRNCLLADSLRRAIAQGPRNLSVILQPRWRGWQWNAF